MTSLPYLRSIFTFVFPPLALLISDVIVSFCHDPTRVGEVEKVKKLEPDSSDVTPIFFCLPYHLLSSFHLSHSHLRYL